MNNALPLAETKIRCKEDYFVVDALKLVLAFGVIMLHHGFPLGWRYGFYAHQAFARLGVPFFFVCAGFFLGIKTNDNNRKQVILAYAKKLIPTYLLLSLFYMTLFFEINNNFSLAGLLINLIAVIKGESYSVMWFVGCLIYCVIIIAHIKPGKHLHISIVIAFIFYLVGLSFNMYRFVFTDTFLQEITDYLAAAFSNQRIIFVGYLYVSIGYWLALKRERIEKALFAFPIRLYVSCGLSFVCLWAEILAVRKLAPPTEGFFGEFYLFHIIAIPLLFLLSLYASRFVAVGHNTAVVARKCSMYVYYWHYAFLLVLGTLFANAGLSSLESYLVVAGATAILAITISLRSIKYKPRLTGWANSVYMFISGHITNIVMLSISLAAFILLSRASSGMTFWADEQISLHIASQPTLAAMADAYFKMEGTGIPFDFLLYLWYRVAPYGEYYLMLLPRLFAALAFYMLGLSGKKLFGDFGGIATTLLASTLPFFLRLGNEVRTYSLYMLAIALLLYVYLSRLSRPEKNTALKLVVMGFSTAFAVYTHPVSALFCAALFVVDVFLTIRRKQKWKFLFSYVLSVILYIPFLAMYLQRSGLYSTSSGSWVPSYPNIDDIFAMLSQLFSGSQWLLIFAACSIVIALTQLKKNGDASACKYALLCTFLSLFVLLAALIVSNSDLVVNSAGSIWLDRYLVPVIPPIVLSSAFCLSVIYNKLKNTAIGRRGYEKPAVMLFAMIMLSSNMTNYISQPGYVMGMWEIKPAVENILAQPDAYNNDTAIYYCLNERLVDLGNTYDDYYFSRKGGRAVPNRLTTLEANASLQVIYTIEQWVTLSADQILYLSEDYAIEYSEPGLGVTKWVRKRT